MNLEILICIFLIVVVPLQKARVKAVCETPIDLVFIVDQSGSICDTDSGFVYGRDNTCNNYKNLLNFIKSIISNFNVGPQSTRVGMVVFHSFAEVKWQLNRYSNSNDLLAAVDGIPYIGGTTNTADGLRKARTGVFSLDGDRHEALKVAILITDGLPNVETENLSYETDSIQNAGVKVFVVGVTKAIDESTLKKISSPPKLVNQSYFLSPSFSDISQINSILRNQLCGEMTQTYNYQKTSQPISPTSSSLPPSSPPVPISNVQLDLVFVVDGSSSICGQPPGNNFEAYSTCDNYQYLLSFLKNFINNLNVGVDTIRIGGMFYYGWSANYFFLDWYTTKDLVIQYLTSLSFQRGIRSMTGALYQMRNIFTSSGSRPNVPNVAVFITDGKPVENFEDLLQEVDRVQISGIKLYTVGVTNEIDSGLIQMMSSSPHQLNKNFFVVNSFSSISNISQNLLNSIYSIY